MKTVLRAGSVAVVCAVALTASAAVAPAATPASDPCVLLSNAYSQELKIIGQRWQLLYHADLASIAAYKALGSMSFAAADRYAAQHDRLYKQAYAMQARLVQAVETVAVWMPLCVGAETAAHAAPVTPTTSSAPAQ